MGGPRGAFGACAHQQCLSEHVAPMPFMQQGVLDSPHRVFEL